MYVGLHVVFLSLLLLHLWLVFQVSKGFSIHFKRICCLWSKEPFFSQTKHISHSSSSCSTIAIGAIWSSWLLGLGSHPISPPKWCIFSRALRFKQEDRRKLYRVVFGSSHLRGNFRWNSVICLEYQGNLLGSRLTMHQKEWKDMIILCNLLLSMLLPHPLCNPHPEQ